MYREGVKFLSLILQDLMRYLNWTKAAILYEDESGLIRLQDLVRSPPSKNLELYIRQTVPSNYRWGKLLGGWVHHSTLFADLAVSCFH